MSIHPFAPKHCLWEAQSAKTVFTGRVGNLLSKFWGHKEFMLNRTLISIIAGLFCLFAWADFAPAQEITAIEYTNQGGQGVLEFTFDTPLLPSDAKVFFMSGGKPRIVIDLKSGAMSRELLAKTSRQALPIGKASVDKVRFAPQQNGVFRLVADLNAGGGLAGYDIKNGALHVRVLGTAPISTAAKHNNDGIPVPHLKPGTVKAARPVISGPRKFAGTPFPRIKPAGYSIAHKTVRTFPVIVIDPGHGGYDPGAIGQKKLKEEHVTLSAALELKKQLLATGRYQVVLTREKDVYVAHEQRVRIAREAGADLFISIHADSTKGHTARGASVYTLADRAQKRASSIISSQNWILDVDLADQSEQVGDILVDLAQRKTLSKSGQFADILIPELAKKSKLIGNSHRRAGYYVLLAPDVPAVLLEMGFLSNAEDEKLLKSPAHRKKLMQSVTTAINLYFATQSPLHASR